MPNNISTYENDDADVEGKISIIINDVTDVVYLLKCALAESRKIRNKEISHFIYMAILSAEENK